MPGPGRPLPPNLPRRNRRRGRPSPARRRRPEGGRRLRDTAGRSPRAPHGPRPPRRAPRRLRYHRRRARPLARSPALSRARAAVVTAPASGRHAPFRLVPLPPLPGTPLPLPGERGRSAIEL